MTKDEDKRRWNLALFVAFFFVAVLWAFFFFTHYAAVLEPAGILPRKTTHWYGILLSPLLHGSWSHLISNTLPAFILSGILVYSYRGIALPTIGAIWVISGVVTWLIGETGTNHIGASGVIYGMAAFLFFSGIIRWEKRLLYISAIVIFLYGSMIWGVLPLEPGISWEGHLSGALSGSALAFILRRKGPSPEEEESLPDEDHTDDDYRSRQFLRDEGSPLDPHYHKDAHKKKKHTYHSPDK